MLMVYTSFNSILYYLQDIGTVQSMQKKVTEMENQLGQLEERVVASKTQSQQFAMAGHFDKDIIIEKEVTMTQRYQALQVRLHLLESLILVAHLSSSS